MYDNFSKSVIITTFVIDMYDIFVFAFKSVRPCEAVFRALHLSFVHYLIITM